MSHVFLIVLYTLFTSSVSNAYYLSLSIFEWKNASTYCQFFCNSHLASIHSQEQHLDSVQLVERNPHTYKDVWIGLNDIHEPNDWLWSDSSVLDFGGYKDENSHIISGSWPWRSGEPDFDSTDDCVAIDTARGNQWSDREQFSNNHFLCNSCSGKFAKYAAINGFNTYEQASAECETRFGTSLASIHSIRDMEEARTTCEGITDGAGCWIGLNDKRTRHDYKWDDGTEWDFGREFNKYPWYYSQPGLYGTQYCIQIDPDPEAYLWDDSDCNSTARTLCNAPSEICTDSQFFIANEADTADSWIWNKKPCEVHNVLMETASVAVISDKQYLNTDGILVIDMMFTMHTVGVNGNGGIAVYLDEGNCDNHYVVGIWGGASLVYFGKFVEGQWNLIQYADVGFVYNMSTYYSLQVELVDGIVWNVRVNDEFMFSEMDDSFNNTGNRLSGYIGIRNSNASLSVKSLYVSGDVQYFDSHLLYLSCNNISTPTPTNEPTSYPTAKPTRIVYQIQEDLTTTPVSTRPRDVAGVGSDGISDILNNFQLFWIIGVPAGILLVCALMSWCMNKYLCDAKEDEVGGAHNSEGVREYMVNV